MILGFRSGAVLRRPEDNNKYYTSLRKEMKEDSQIEITEDIYLY